MSIKIIMAQDSVHIDGILKVRHKVFSEEESKFEATADGRVLDRFDAYPTTHNLAVLSGDEVVGGMRLVLDSAMGVPGDAYYDFRSRLPAEYKLLNCGMYCITKPFRSSRLAMGLLLMASYFALSHDVTHVIAPINPAIAKLLGRVGFEALEGKLTDPHSGLVIMPMLLDMRNLNDFFSKFVESNRLHNFVASYECVYYERDEPVIHAGESADAAFVIIEGQIEVRVPGSGKVLATMGEGEVFGELALLTDDVRSADVVAISDVRVMSLPKSIFIEHLLTHPEQAMLMLKSIGNRMKNMLSQAA